MAAPVCGFGPSPGEARRASNDFRIFRFTKAVRPVLFNPHRENPRDRRGTILADSKSCARCHASIYANWYGSQHRTAFSDELFQDGYRKEPMQWCVNCHAPFVRSGPGANTRGTRFQAADGISCLVCHVRDGKILTARRPAVPAPAHDYEIIPAISKSSFCAQCHQFNMPTREAVLKGHDPSAFRYAHTPMQNTYREWRESTYAARQSCGDCHLRPDTLHSHRFPGGHDLEYLRKTFSVHARRLGGHRVEITLLARGIGHAFPTGDPFRVLRLRLTDDGPYFFQEFELRKRWQKSKAGDHASRILVEDSTLPPPAAGEIQMTRTWIVRQKRAHGRIRYRLWLDYLQGLNAVVSNIEDGETSILIHDGRVPAH